MQSSTTHHHCPICHHFVSHFCLHCQALMLRLFVLNGNCRELWAAWMEIVESCELPAGLQLDTNILLFLSLQHNHHGTHHHLLWYHMIRVCWAVLHISVIPCGTIWSVCAEQSYTSVTSPVVPHNHLMLSSLTHQCHPLWYHIITKCCAVLHISVIPCGTT